MLSYRATLQASTYFTPSRFPHRTKVKEMTTAELAYNQAAIAQMPVVEFITITGLSDARRYIAIYRKWFNEKLSAWELELVPGTLRWID
jgi:hypothetical protein